MKIQRAALVLIVGISLVGCSAPVKNNTDNLSQNSAETKLHLELNINEQSVEETEETTSEIEETSELEETTSELEETTSEVITEIKQEYTYNQDVKQQYQNVRLQMDGYTFLGHDGITNYFKPAVHGFLGNNGIMISYLNTNNSVPLMNFNEVVGNEVKVLAELTHEDGTTEITEMVLPITFDLMIPLEVRQQLNLNLTIEEITDCNMLWTEFNGEKYLLASKNIGDRSYGICVTQNGGIVKMVAVMDNIEALKLQDMAYSIMKSSDFNCKPSVMIGSNDIKKELESDKILKLTQGIDIELGVTKLDNILNSLKDYRIIQEEITDSIINIYIDNDNTVKPLILTVNTEGTILGIEADYSTDRNKIYVAVYPQLFSPYTTLDEIIEHLGEKYTESKLDDGSTEYSWSLNDCIYTCTIYHKTNGVAAISKCRIIKDFVDVQLKSVVGNVDTVVLN